MPDFFIDNSKADFSTNPERTNQINKTSKSYWDNINSKQEQKNAEYLQDLQKYSVHIPQEQYNAIKDVIADAENPEDEAYRWASALELNKQYGMPVDYCYQNLEQINSAIWGDKYTFTPKTNFKAIVDNGHLGWNTLQMGKLGSKIMLAESAFNQGNLLADGEDLESLYKQYEQYELENESLQDYQDRNFIIECLKFGAQSAPFTGSVIAASAVGSLIAPGVGTAAAFATSMANAAGLQYMQMRKDGSSAESAMGFSLVSGALQAVVETSLGNVAGALGRNSLGDLATEAVKQKITGNVFKRLVSDGTFKSLGLRLTKEYVKENWEEGLEEVIQNFIEKGTSALAAELGGYNVEGLDAKSIAKETWENFKGGVMGSLILGLPTSAIKVNASVKEFADVRKAAEVIPSQEAFNKVTDNSIIWEGLSEEEKKEAQKNTWEKAQARIEATAEAEAKKIKEVQDAAEGSEELKTGDEGEETEARPVTRNEKTGKLYTQEDVIYDDENNPTGGRFVAGDDKNLTEADGKKGFARYGYIDWEFADGDQSKIIINDFKMAKGREGIRAEVFNDFAIEHPGVDIQWNTKGSEAQAVKEQLISENPSGAKNGLNYYADENAVADASTRAWVDKQVTEHITDYEIVDNKVKKVKLSKEKRAAAVALLEAAAKRQNMSLTEYVNKTFGNEIFGDTRNLQKAELAQAMQDQKEGKDVTRKAGGVRVGRAQTGWREYGQQVKAVIYAGENADFSTWTHELAHIFQNQLDGDLKVQAEKAFNVIDGDWQKSMYTFADGKSMSAAEAFAYGFQDWLKTGKAENEQMKNIFEKFAQFVARAFNSLKNFINLTPEITDVYNQLLAGDDSMLKAAEIAVEAEDRRYRAQMAKQAQEAEQNKMAEAEQQKKAEEAEREEASETTEFSEEENETTPEEAEAKLDEVANEKNTDETNAIDNALENTNLTDEQKTEIAETLKDENSTVIDKAEATTEAASSVYEDDEIIPDDLFFQLAGEPSIRRMAESEEKERMLTELDAAQLLDEKYKSMDADSKAARIRRATGWEKDRNGNWKYELDDSVNRIKTEFFKNNPDVLNGGNYLINLGDILDADELYKVFPYMKNVRVNFYSDPNAFRAVLTPNGIMVNTRYLKGMNGENGLKGVLAHEIQHIIQAMEFAESKGLQGQDLRQLYNDVMDAMKAAGERHYNYDLSSMQAGLDAYMNDAGEIEARNVARRILMNADARRMNTLASTEDVERQIQFQDDITDEELKEIISKISPSEESESYKKQYYDDVPELYEKRSFKTSDGNEFIANAPKNRKVKQHEIDEAYYLLSKGYKVAFLDEPATKGGHPDLILNDNLIIEQKQITGNANTAAKKIREAINKQGVDVPMIFFMDNAVNLSNEEVLAALEKDMPHIKRDVDNIVIIRNYDNISVLNKKASGTAYAEARRTSNIAQEIEAVKQKYQNTDKWLKAPNGEDSNLDEKQWVQVRTPSFKKWFGDWDIDPANASKVLDENGEPLVVYHGTDADFTIFDASKSRANMDIQGNFFSPWDIDAQGYGPNVRAFYLNIRNPANSRQGYSSLNTFKGQNEAGIKARELLKSKGFDGVNNDNEEYITFEPNQIKSATDNNGNFDANNPDILFQIAGEIGAENLDNSEVQEGVSRMQNLAIAKQMETDGKDAKAIRLATGWEKGGDGKWKYEIDDSKIKTDFEDKSYLFRIRNPRYGELEKKLKSLNYDWEKLSKEEQEEFDKLGDLYNESLERNEVVLMEILDAPELFRAYPQLREMPVTFKTRDYSQNYEAHLVNGYYVDDNSPYFAIEFNGTPNSYNSERFKSTLLHEIQHAIQRIEGFGRGGNLEEAAELIEKDNQKKAEIKSKAFAWEWKIELEKQEEKYPELKGNLALMNSLIDEYTENGKYPIKELEDEHWLPERDIRDKGFNLYVRGYDKEGFEEAYKEWQEKAGKKGVTVFNPTKDTERNRFNYYKRFAGEIESRNVQTRMNFTPEQRLNTLIAETEDVAPEDKIILFQIAYHGSAADFDKFDTENYGLSGEGSMSFGYGTYVTDDEEIARDYAHRQAGAAKPEYSMAEVILQRVEQEGYTFEQAKQEAINRYSKWDQASAGNQAYMKARYDYARSIKSLDDVKETLSEIDKRKLYTVNIPDDGYISWNEPITQEMLDRITPVYAEEMYNRWLNDSESQDGFIVYNDMQKKGIRKSFEDELQRELDADPNYDGAQLYKHIQRKLEYYDKENGAKLASKLLNKAGFAGIKYPAGTIHGNGNGAYNYVIFNDDDAQIVDKLFFQTEAELMDEARSFDNWQDFMEYCENNHADDDVSPIPFNNDAQWYQTFWEMANGVQAEVEKNEQAVNEKNKEEGMLPGAVDALFKTYLRTNPEMVDNFLRAVADIDAIDLDSEEWQQADDAESAQQRDRIDQLKDFINITLSDYNWQTAIKRIQGGHEIAEGLRKRLIGEMTDDFKVRDFRAIYAEVMDDEQYAVDEKDSITNQLNEKLSKYQKRYYDILRPNEDIGRVSPERRKRIAEAMQNRDIAAKIKNGTLKLDDEVDAYIKSLDKQIDSLQKEYNELEKETKADYQRMADAERRKLLKLHEELLLAGSKMKKHDAEIERKIKKGLKVTEKYQRESQNMTANYDELFRKFTDLKNTIQITAEVQAALDRQEQVAGLRDDLNAKQKEKNLTAEVKKMRIQLVKRTMRRVPFNRIDFNNARTVIAIQRMLEPNLLGGVNRFIGIDSPYLRGVISQYVTDSDYKEELLKYLRYTAKSSKAFTSFMEKLENLKSVKDFDSWTAKDRKAAIRYLPKENWVRDLNLRQLAKEREESIDLDIGMEEVKRTVYDEKTGEPKKFKDPDGNEHNVMESSFRLQYDPEIGQIVNDAVGADMFDKIINLPFNEWTTEDLEQLAQRIDEIYTEGRDLLEAKREAKKREADKIRKRIENAIRETGITINDDDTPEEKERKQKKINKILGDSTGMKGTEAGKSKGIAAKLNRLLHSYNDMNVLRFARMLDGQSEGENYRMLYRMEDDCYNTKQRSMANRASTVNKVMADNKITEGDLAKSIKVPELGTEFTVDELLYFLAADKDFELDQNGNNDDFAATSRNAVMFGNMMSDEASQQLKADWDAIDKAMQDAIANDLLTPEQKQLMATGELDTAPGTTRYRRECHKRWGIVLGTALQFLNENPQYNALLEAIEADYASQYERMNEVSITEFNQPVHRVKAYVPLVRRESNGDTNENQVREDLLGAAGVGKQWADRGMTKRRVNIGPLHQKPVQTGLFRTWGDSIERTEHFIAYAPYVRQLNAIYKSRDAAYTRRFIESRYGKSAIEYLDAYINEVANPNAGRIREKGAEWLHVLRGKTAPAYLGWKASGIIKQGLTSPWPYMQFVNPAEYLSAAMKFTFNSEMRDAISEKSIFMKMRRMDPVNDLIDEMAENAKGKVDRAWSKFSQIGMQGLEMIDWACVAPGWLACYEKKYNQLQKASEARYNAKMAELKERNIYAEVGTSEYLTPEQMEAQARKEMTEDIETEAVRYADDCTRACQPSNRVTDLAPLFKNSSEAMKAFLQFQTSLNVIWQNIRYDLPYAVKQKEFKRIAGTVIGYVCAGIFMNSVMDGVRGDDDDDDDMQALRNLIYYSTTQFTDAIPIMGSEITNVMDKVITGKRAYSQSGTDMTPSATKLLNALQKVTSGDYKKAASLTAEGIGLFMGAPVSGVKEINKLLGKPLSEGEINIKKGVGDVYGAVGDIIGE